MRTPQVGTVERESATSRWSVALSELKNGANPFGAGVSVTATLADVRHTDVCEHAASQLKDLLDIVAMYRTGRPATRIFAVIGDPGSGKTHLLQVLFSELEQQ